MPATISALMISLAANSTPRQNHAPCVWAVSSGQTSRPYTMAAIVLDTDSIGFRDDKFYEYLAGKTSLLEMKAEAQEECQKLFHSYQNIHDKKLLTLLKRIFDKRVQTAVPAEIIVTASRNLIKDMVHIKAVTSLHEVAHTVIHHVILFSSYEEKEFQFGIQVFSILFTFSTKRLVICLFEWSGRIASHISEQIRISFKPISMVWAHPIDNPQIPVCSGPVIMGRIISLPYTASDC